MNMGKKTSWQLVAIAAAALLGGVAQADGRDHRGRGDDRGWRQQDRQHDGRRYEGRRYDGRHDRGWHHGDRHRHNHRHYGHHSRHGAPQHWRYGPPRHYHRHHSYYRSGYWVPEPSGMRVTIGFPL